MPPSYDARNFLQLLGIEVTGEGPDAVGRLTVTHPLIAGTGFLWAPVVIAVADALCACGVNHHWPAGATSFTTIECKSNFLSSAREGESVMAQPRRSIWGGRRRCGMRPSPTKRPSGPWRPTGARS
jgi:1,4-dihydroxy-2-naphthoyl-CoA hydrolase